MQLGDQSSKVTCTGCLPREVSSGDAAPRPQAPVIPRPTHNTVRMASLCSMIKKSAWGTFDFWVRVTCCIGQCCAQSEARPLHPLAVTFAFYQRMVTSMLDDMLCITDLIVATQTIAGYDGLRASHARASSLRG